jgi:biopolymer transport protein ExbB
MQSAPNRLKQSPWFPLALAWLALAAGAGSVRAASWWNSDWSIRRQITVDTSATGAAITGPIGSVPVLVRLHDGDFSFDAAQPDGSDLRFVAADDKTVLPSHLEKYDSLLHEAFVWVKLPDLAPGAKTTIWLYYGYHGSKALPPGEPKAFYDESTMLVYHFAEHGSPAADASGNGNNSLASGLAADGALIGTGLRLDGRTIVTVPSSSSMAFKAGGGVTWSVWANFGPPVGRAILFNQRDTTRYLLVGADNGVPFAEVSDGVTVVRTPAGPVVSSGTWHHLALVAGGDKITLYLDGAPYATVAASIPALNGQSNIGGDGEVGPLNPADGNFVGQIDELEISRTERPLGAVKLAVVNQGGAASTPLLTYGDEETPKNWLSGFKAGYVGVILGSLSVDGWVVIGILLVMSIVSWVVMIGKASYLNRISAGNQLFLKEWRHVANDLSVLDAQDADQAKSMGGRFDAAKHRAMRFAPLYRIYHIGAEEIQKRLSAAKAGETKALSGQSIQAIRAALDGGLVHEMQRLNNQMVLLTIAISGGPFLGLLGTVVGVMITFAAVAQAGDVNVNAIAPGIAAALAATVAGLAVAIPALFGYNYLLTKIKAASNDMHVFIDEFVTKLAEFYSGPAS